MRGGDEGGHPLGAECGQGSPATPRPRREPSSTPGTRWLWRSVRVGDAHAARCGNVRATLVFSHPFREPRVTTARRTHGFRESVIRGMTRLAREYNSLNLAQGFPNFPAPDVLKEAAARAIQDDINQYAITWGAQRLRDALARNYPSAVRPRRRSRARDHRHLRRHRGDDRHAAGGGESGRRSDRLRAVLRELRPRHDPRGRQAGVRPAGARSAARPRATGGAPSRRGPAPSSSTRRAIPRAGC